MTLETKKECTLGYLWQVAMYLLFTKKSWKVTGKEENYNHSMPKTMALFSSFLICFAFRGNIESKETNLFP